MPHVFIIHGWAGHPNEGWFPWLKKELEERGFEVSIPEMPDPENPKIETWILHLKSVIGIPNESTYLIGHSIGVQTILRYLQTIDRPIGGVLAVAGFFVLRDGCLKLDEMIIAEPWLKMPIDVDAAKKNTKSITAIFSDNDPFVPVENAKLFERRLDAKTIILHQRGHFSNSDNALEVPEILQEFLLIASAQSSPKLT